MAGRLSPEFVDLVRKEEMCGAVNLLMILGVMGLAVFKPAWRRDKTNPVEARP